MPLASAVANDRVDVIEERYNRSMTLEKNEAQVLAELFTELIRRQPEQKQPLEALQRRFKRNLPRNSMKDLQRVENILTSFTRPGRADELVSSARHKVWMAITEPSETAQPQGRLVTTRLRSTS